MTVAKFSMIECTEEKYAPSILNILNDTIINSTALYEYKPRTIESMTDWFKVKIDNQFPVIGIVDDHENLMGFSTWGTFRAFPAYQYTVEHSIYIHPDYRQQGLSLILMNALIERAKQEQIHVLIGGIDSQNSISIKLHEKLGFTHAGTLKEVGYKFGHWLDLAFYQLKLDTVLEQ